MTLRYDKDATFLDLPMTAVRDTLRRYHRTYKMSSAAESSRSKLDPITACVVVDEAFSQGLFAFDEHGRPGITAAGDRLVKATTLPPLPRAKALDILNAILPNAILINSDPDFEQWVERIWLFGSLAKKENKFVNDIDIAVDLAYRQIPPEQLSARYRRRLEALARKYRVAIPDINVGENVFWAHDHILNRVLYGHRRHPRLAPNNRLKTLHTPCKLIFDRSRSAINDPLLPCYPGAEIYPLPEPRDQTPPTLDPRGRLEPIRPVFVRIPPQRRRLIAPTNYVPPLFDVDDVPPSWLSPELNAWIARQN